MNELRINARLDEKLSKDLQFLRKELGNKSITAVVKYSIQKLAQELRDSTQAKRQKQLWLESGFVGGFEGPENLSSNYKQHLSDILDEKYPPEQ
jgi:hypothetical protein